MNYFEVLRAIIKYQFGVKIPKLDYEFEISKTGRLRRIYLNGKLLFTIEPTTGFVIPTIEGGEFLKKYLEFPRYRVIISDEAVPFVSEGRSVFAKFVIDVDKNILPKDIVLVVDKKDNLIAVGETLLSSSEMLDFEYGVAVKVKHAKKK